MVDTPGLGPGAHCERGGSSPLLSTIMQILAHRGWSMDTSKQTTWRENSLSAFDLTQAHPDITGIEIDIRRHPTTGKIVLSHDPIETEEAVQFAQNQTTKYTTLTEILSLVKKYNWEIVIEFKECDAQIFDEVAQMIIAQNLQNQTTLFGFEEVAQNFPWQNRQNYPNIKLGIIAEYPWQIAGIVRKYRPNTLLIGWDERPWTFVAFATWWSIFNLRKITQKHNVTLIAGVAQSTKQLAWARKIGITAIIADMHPITQTTQK